MGASAGVPIVKGDTVAALAVTARPAYQAVRPFPLRRGHAVGRAVRLALQRRQIFIWVAFHVVPPFFAFAVLPEKASCPRRRKLRIVCFAASGKTHSLRCSSSPHKAIRLCGGPDNGGVFRRWHAPHNFGTLCPEAGSLRCFPSRGIPFRTVILFSRCSSSMNYLKCILF